MPSRIVFWIPVWFMESIRKQKQCFLPDQLAQAGFVANRCGG
jgi:hypothetical protein